MRAIFKRGIPFLFYVLAFVLSGMHKVEAATIGTVPAAPPGATATTTVFTQSTPTAIPTGPAVVTSTVVVSGAGSAVWDINLRTFLTHTFAADLDITIQSPAGTVVTLTTDNGAGNDNVFNGTVWDDQANPAGQVPYTTNNGLATDNAYVNLTLASPLVPEEALGAFRNEDPNGTWTITISDDLAGDGGSLTWDLEVTTFASAPTEISTAFTQSTPTAIPTGPAVVTSTVTVSGATSTLVDLTLVTNITHTFGADLDITLASPAGTVVTLTTDNGAGNDNTFNGTLWTDKGNLGGQVPYTTNNGLATDNAYVNLTTATPLVPEEAMAAFAGEDPNGVWTITISDDLTGDGGSLDSWTLTVITGQVQADLAIVKTVAANGDNLDYTIIVTNNGPGDATGVTVTDVLPAQVTYLSDDSGIGPPAGGTLTWNIGNLANGANDTAVITVAVNPGVNAAILNTATVTGNESDPTPGNDSSTAAIVTNPFGDSDGDGIPDYKDPDRDGDGVNNDLDPAPDDPGNSGTFGVPGLPGLTVKKLTVKLNFTTPGKDKIVVSGIFPVDPGFVALGATVDADIGGEARSFTLDEKGLAKNGNDFFKVRVKARPDAAGTFNGSWKLILKNGTFTVLDVFSSALDGSTPGIADRILKTTLTVGGATPDTRYNVGTAVYDSSAEKGKAKNKKL